MEITGYLKFKSKKNKELDETKGIRSDKKYSSQLINIYTKMKSKSKEILDPESFKKLAK